MDLQEQNRRLASELNRVEEMLSTSRAERDQLGIKYDALSERLDVGGLCPLTTPTTATTSPTPPLSSPKTLTQQNAELRQRLEDEHSGYKRKLMSYQEGQQRQAQLVQKLQAKEGQQRQAQLVQKLQAKLMQYKKKCEDLEYAVREKDSDRLRGYNKSVVVLCVMVVLCGGTVTPDRRGLSDLKLTVQELFDMLGVLQVKRDRPFIAPMLWQEDKGIYPSDVRLNFVGAPAVALLRELISVFDNNMFATAWITSTLLEAHHYAAAPRPFDQQVVMALDAMASHRNRNVNFTNSIMAFWPQAFDTNTSLWVSTPANLLDAYQVFSQLPWDNIDKELEKLGLQKVEYFLKNILKRQSSYLKVFHIPPDFDDTFVNLGLGSLLADMGQDLPQPLQRWRESNTNLTSVLDALRRYAYRPFSADEAVNTIDTRTYYYMRYFLNYASDKGLDVAMVPTWVQSIPEARKYYGRGVVMPSQVNNVDVTVSANALYGLTGAVLSGLLPSSILDFKQDPEIAQIYHNTTTMITFMINNTFFGRPDLALTYYPSAFEFYWFVARTYHRMDLTRQTQPLPPLMEEAFPMLKGALEGAMTRHVITTGTEDGDDMKFYDDFLGDADLDANNQTEVKGEDRLYTTTMAVNALLTTWTMTNASTRAVTWRAGTPDDVKNTTAKCVKWLSTNILGTKYKPWNAFFSGSAKGNTTSSSYYPGNRLELLNGTRVHDYHRRPKDTFVYGMEGHIPESQYEALVKNASMHFGHKTPTEFVSFNDPSRFFPFWSSPAYTYATTMLALSRYDSLVN